MWDKLWKYVLTPQAYRCKLTRFMNGLRNYERSWLAGLLLRHGGDILRYLYDKRIDCDRNLAAFRG